MMGANLAYSLLATQPRPGALRRRAGRVELRVRRALPLMRTASRMPGLGREKSLELISTSSGRQVLLSTFLLAAASSEPGASHSLLGSRGGRRHSRSRFSELVSTCSWGAMSWGGGTRPERLLSSGKERRAGRG